MITKYAPYIMNKNINPWSGMMLNEDNPITRGLGYAYVMNEGKGLKIYNFGKLGIPALLGSGLNWGKSVYGKELKFLGGTSTRVLNCGTQDFVNANGEMSCFFKFNAISLGTSNAARLFVRGGSYDFGVQASNRLHFAVVCSTTSMDWQSITNVFNLGKEQDGCITYKGSTSANDVKCYAQGLEAAVNATVNGVGTITSVAGNTSKIGNTNTATRSWDGTIRLGYIWNRAISFGEYNALHKDPYSIFVPARRRGIIFPAITFVSSTATPSKAAVSIIVNSATTKVSNSAIASPSISTIKMNIGRHNPFITNTVAPSITRISIIAGQATAKTTRSAIAAPSLCSVTVSVGVATASSKIITIASPSLASLSVVVQSATTLKKTNVSPALTSLTVLVNAPSVKTSRSAIATPSISSISVLVGSATASTSAGATIATPAVSTIQILVNTPTVKVSRSSISTPSISVVTIGVNAPTVKVSKSAIANASLSSISITVGSPTTKAYRNANATPSQTSIAVVVGQATASSIVSSNSTATPAISRITITVLSPTVSTPQDSGLTITILLKSPIEKEARFASRIEKYFTDKSEIGKFISQESRITKYINEESQIEKSFALKSQVDND